MQQLLKLGLLGSFCLCSIISLAQKKQYTMAEATNGIATTLAPKGIKSPAWRPGTHEFYYRDVNGTLKVFNADNKDTTIADRRAYRKAGFAWLSHKSGYYTMNDTLEISDWETRKDTMVTTRINRLNKGYANLQFAKNGSSYAYTVDNNLYYGDANNAPVAVTLDANRNIVNGQAVHRNEFGIDNGIFFSPKGTYLAYYRMDQSMVEDYPVIDWSVTPAKNENVKYPMAGRTSHQVTLQVYNPATRQTTAINPDVGPAGPIEQ